MNSVHRHHCHSIQFIYCLDFVFQLADNVRYSEPQSNNNSVCDLFALRKSVLL